MRFDFKLKEHFLKLKAGEESRLLRSTLPALAEFRALPGTFGSAGLLGREDRRCFPRTLVNLASEWRGRGLQTTRAGALRANGLTILYNRVAANR